MPDILLEPAFALGFACCFGLIATGLLLFMLCAPPIERMVPRYRPPRRTWRAIVGDIRATARRWARGLAGFAAVTAFWAVLFATLLAPQP